MILVIEDSVRFEGEKHTVLTEFTMLIKNMLDCLTEEDGREAALEQIAECGRLACMTPEELAEHARNKIEEIKDKVGRDDEEIEKVLGIIDDILNY